MCVPNVAVKSKVPECTWFNLSAKNKVGLGLRHNTAINNMNRDWDDVIDCLCI